MFRVYGRDVKNITTNYVTLIIITALIILPSLYAWFNIKAGWNPYGNTKGLSVAVVNLDEGTEFKNTKINVGDDVVKELANNQSIGWKFVSEDEAEEGVNYGTYYASITVPKDFSKNLLSVITDDTPKKAELIYNVNEKTNAIAPKITDKGATTLQEEITKTFIQTASNTTLSYLNQFGVELEKNKPELQKIADLIIDLDGKMPGIGQSIDNTYDETVALQKYIQKVLGETSEITDTVNKTVDMAKNNNESINKAGDLLQSIFPIVKANIALVKNNTDDNKALLEKAKGLNSSSSNTLKESLKDINNKYQDCKDRIDVVLSLMKSINSRLNNSVIDKFINNLLDVRSEISGHQNRIKSVINSLDSAKQISDSSLTELINGANKISGLMDNLNANFDNETSPKIEASLKDFQGLSNDTVKILEDIQSSLPLANSLLKGADTGTGLSIDGINDIKDKFPTIKEDVHSNAEKLKSLNDDEKFNEIVRILKKDATKESDFLANPIDLKENRVYPIPNYGSAMSPFYSTLAIWVGGFILVSLLSVEVKELEEGEPLHARVKFWGRYLTFLTIGMLQAVVVLLGNLSILKTYVIAQTPYLLYGVYVSIIFTTIIYTTVSVFGNIGKALIMVLMVLQVSASGGTFPVQLLGSFFQHINPLLPFTYAIGGLRETVAGIIPKILMKDALILAIYYFICIFLGMVLKEKVNKLSEKFVQQFKDSGLTGE